MSLDEKVRYLESLVPLMEYVKKGDYVLAKHTNVFVDFVNGSLDVIKDIYNLFKAKTGRSLPDAEFYIGMADSRAGLMRKVKFGDIARVQDHNLVIDALKAIEIALRIIEANL